MVETTHDIANARATTLRVLADIGVERQRQDAKWGQQSHPDAPANVGHPNAFFGLPTEAAAKLLCDDAAKRGTLSFGHILLEEVCEAYTAINNPADLRAELVQVAAVAAAWVECIDRRAAAPVFLGVDLAAGRDPSIAGRARA